MPPVATSRAPNKHARDGLVADKTHGHTTAAALADLPGRVIRLNRGICRGIDGLATPRARFMDSVGKWEQKTKQKKTR